MEKTNEKADIVSPVVTKKLSPSQQKLAEMNAYLAKTDTAQLFRLIDEIRDDERTKQRDKQ